MNRTTIGFLTILLLILLAESTVCAQTIPSAYRFVETGQTAMLYAGYVNTGRGALELGPEPALVLGGRYGIRVSAPLVLEADASLLFSRRTVYDTIPADTMLRTVGEADMRVVALQALARFNVTGSRTFHGIQPYLLGGAGAAFDMAGDSPTESDVAIDARLHFGLRFVWQLGGGLDLFFSDRLSLRAEARNVAWRLDTPTPFLLRGAALFRPEDEWVQNFYLSAGLALHF